MSRCAQRLHLVGIISRASLVCSMTCMFLLGLPASDGLHSLLLTQNNDVIDLTEPLMEIDDIDLVRCLRRPSFL
jgi:hypothetical protein